MRRLRGLTCGVFLIASPFCSHWKSVCSAPGDAGLVFRNGGPLTANVSTLSSGQLNAYTKTPEVSPGFQEKLCFSLRLGEQRDSLQREQIFFMPCLLFL